MRIIIQDDTGHPVDSIIIVDELVDAGEVATIVASMISDYVSAKDVISALAKRRIHRQKQVAEQFSNHCPEDEDVPF